MKILQRPFPRLDITLAIWTKTQTFLLSIKSGQHPEGPIRETKEPGRICRLMSERAVTVSPCGFVKCFPTPEFEMPSTI